MDQHTNQTQNSTRHTKDMRPISSPALGPTSDTILPFLAHERRNLQTRTLEIATAVVLFVAALNTVGWFMVPGWRGFIAMHTLAAGTICAGGVVMALLSFYTARVRGY